MGGGCPVARMYAGSCAEGGKIRPGACTAFFARCALLALVEDVADFLDGQNPSRCYAAEGAVGGSVGDFLFFRLGSGVLALGGSGRCGGDVGRKGGEGF